MSRAPKRVELLPYDPATTPNIIPFITYAEFMLRTPDMLAAKRKRSRAAEVLISWNLLARISAHALGIKDRFIGISPAEINPLMFSATAKPSANFIYPPDETEPWYAAQGLILPGTFRESCLAAQPYRDLLTKRDKIRAFGYTPRRQEADAHQWNNFVETALQYFHA